MTVDYIERAERLDREIHALHMKCSFRLLENREIHPGQMPILVELCKLDGCNQTQLAKGLGVSSASVGMSLKRMEKAGYIARKADEKDLRTNTVCLTQEGKEMLCRCAEIMTLLMEQKLKGFSETEREEFIGFLERVCENMREYRNALDPE